MKKILFTLALLVSFGSFGQSFQDLKDSSFKEGIVRKFLDNKDELKPLEGIWNFSSSNPAIKSAYKILILFNENEFEYQGIIMDGRCDGCQKWWISKAEIKFTLEESVGGEYNYKWFSPSKRNKKGIRKKPNAYLSGVAYEEGENLITLEFAGTNNYFHKKYPQF